MKTFLVEVKQCVRVTLDESKFDADFFAEFSRSIFPCDTLEEHACHLAQLEARGVSTPDFEEGYGPHAGMGIKLDVISSGEEVIDG